MKFHLLFSILSIIQFIIYLIGEGELVNAQSSGLIYGNSFADGGSFSGYGTYKITFTTSSYQISVGYVASGLSPTYSRYNLLSYYSPYETQINANGNVNFVLYNSGSALASYSGFTIERLFTPVYTYSSSQATIPASKYETYSFSGYSSYSYTATLATTTPKSMSFRVVQAYSPPTTQPTTGFTKITTPSIGSVEFALPSLISSSYNYYIYVKCEETSGNCPTTLSVQEYSSSGPGNGGNGASIIGVIIGTVVGVVVLCCLCCLILCICVAVRNRRGRHANSPTYVNTSTISTTTSVPHVVTSPSATTTTTESVYVQPPQYGYTLPQPPYSGTGVYYNAPPQSSYVNPGTGVYYPPHNNYEEPEYNPNVDPTQV